MSQTHSITHGMLIFYGHISVVVNRVGFFYGFATYNLIRKPFWMFAGVKILGVGGGFDF